MRPQAGHTLLDLTVSSALLLMLLVVCFLIYRQGSGAWQKGSAQAELVQQLQTVYRRLGEEVEHSIYASLAADPSLPPASAVSMLSCYDKTGDQYRYDPVQRSPIWQKHMVFYYDAPSGEIRLTEVPLATPSATPTPLTGLAAYRNGGHVLARRVTRCEIRCANRALEVVLEAQKKHYGAELPARFSLPATLLFPG